MFFWQKYGKQEKTYPTISYVAYDILRGFWRKYILRFRPFFPAKIRGPSYNFSLFYRRHKNYTSYENLELEVPFAIRTIVHLKQKEIFYATLSKNTGYLNYQLSKINHFVLLKMCKTQ